MKKPTATATATSALAALVGLSAWSMTAAVAVTPAPIADETPGSAVSVTAGPYAGCGVARLDGASDFGADTPGFAPHLDVDGDGIACESSGDDEGYLLQPDGSVLRLSELPPSSIVVGPDSVVYDTCADARAAGALPLLHLEPGYGFYLDRNLNGVACEDAADEVPGAGVPAPSAPAQPSPAAPTPEAPQVDEAPQIEEVPVGGADTGAAQSSDRTSLLVGGSVLALVGLAGAGLLLRRGIKG